MTPAYAIDCIADCRPETGLGHAARSYALAARLAERGARVRVRVHGRLPEGALAAPAGVEARDYGSEAELDGALRREWAEKRPHLLVADSYTLGRRFFAGLRDDFPSVPRLAFDDVGEKSGYPLSGILHPHPADALRQPDPDHAAAFAGERYVLIRPEMLRAAASGAPAAGTPGGRPGPVLLVAFGGSDPEGQTLRAARVLAGAAELPCAEIRLLLGPAYGDAGPLLALAAADPRFRVYRHPPDLREVMAGADLALCGGGSTCYELLHLGVPVAVLALAPNQRAAGAAAAGRGCGAFLGDFRDVSDTALLAALRGLLRDLPALRAMGAEAARFIDGSGADRLAADLLAFLDRYHGDQFPVDAVRVEYDTAAADPVEYRKLKWGSREGMFNRFAMARAAIRWEGVGSWLDIGSGTGAFLLDVERERLLDAFLGLDLSPALTAYASERAYRSRSVAFRTADFLEPFGGERFDLVTLLGVLQKCGASLHKAVGRAAECLAPGGQLFLTTKNLDWGRFREPGFRPEPDHHWFRPAEVEAALRHAGLSVLRIAAFDPRTAGVCPSLDGSHSFFAHARKASPA